MDLLEQCIRGCRNERQLAHLTSYVGLHPEEARNESDDGSLPLHYLLRTRPPIKAVEAIFNAYPEAVFCRETANQNLPLHIACRSACAPEVVEFLILRNKSALRYRTQNSFFCCIQKLIVVCLVPTTGRGKSCSDLVIRLPVDHPNRAGLLEVLEKYE